MDFPSSGCYNKDGKEIFEFVKELLAQGKRRASGLTLDSLYSCLNRTILFELSREADCLARRTAVLDTLHRLKDNRSLVFGPGNFDLEFISCLTHCLLELTSSRHQVVLGEAQTQWHVDNATDSLSHHDESILILESAADRIWEELYVHKKPVCTNTYSYCYLYAISSLAPRHVPVFFLVLQSIEESLKVSLTLSAESDSSPKIVTPSLSSLREKLSEPAARSWNAFYESQKRSSLKDVEK
jgi:hypothetical protein